MIRLCAQNLLGPDDSYVAILFSPRRCIFIKHSRYKYKIRELFSPEKIGKVKSENVTLDVIFGKIGQGETQRG